MRSPVPRHLEFLFDKAKAEVEMDGVIAADTGICLIAEGYDPDAVAADLQRQLEDEQ